MQYRALKAPHFNSQNKNDCDNNLSDSSDQFSSRQSFMLDFWNSTDSPTKIESNESSYPPKEYRNNDTDSVYKVKTGDSLWEIARLSLIKMGLANPSKHQTNEEVHKIIKANSDLFSASETSKKLFPGMLLHIPVSEIFIEPLSYLANKGARHHFHFSPTLHRVESAVKSISKKVIDEVHHWLDAVAAEAFLLAKAEAAAHGVHIQVSSAGRTYADQSRLYKQLHGHSPVAHPGSSNHETGLAIDVADWRQAKPYLLTHGFVHGDGHGPIKNDPWHFKYVGITSEA